jgi:hypothetical protein
MIDTDKGHSSLDFATAAPVLAFARVNHVAAFFIDCAVIMAVSSGEAFDGRAEQ